jgi:5-methylphenazine-1-carboxylate 1-monooxygenase
VVDRLGADAVALGAKVTGYAQTPDGVSARIIHADGRVEDVAGALLIGADGIHSRVRAQMHPGQPPIHWGGAIMWRGTVRARPLRTGSSFIGLGTHRHRIVLYPISAPDVNGLALINWIAEVTVDPSHGWQQDGWFRPVEIAEFLHHFDAFRYDWLDVPAMLHAADCAYENPMIDRDPLPRWVEGRVGLMGDAAHPMYPTGSNGASQAIVDGRVLGAMMLAHGVTQAALAAYDARLCAPISAVQLRNRGAGPFGLLNLLDARSGGVFEDIDAVIPPEERAEFMAGYKAAAGFAMEALNAAPPTIPPGARLG